MMVPHYQDAIDMDEVVLRHGHNEKIRRGSPGDRGHASCRGRAEVIEPEVAGQ